jgi:hypothetical protein
MSTLHEATKAIEQLHRVQQSLPRAWEPQKATERLREVTEQARRVLEALPSQVPGEPTGRIARDLMVQIALAEGYLKEADHDAS